MQFKFWNFFYIALFCLGYNSVFVYSKDLNKEKEISNLSVDYLQQTPSTDYILGKGDSLLIIISRDYYELNSTSIISGEGTINLPSIGTVYVDGLTLIELTELLNKAYKKFVKYPNIEIKILNYRPIKIFVNGEVNSPGLQTLKGSMTIGNQLSLNPTEISTPKSVRQLMNSNINFYFPTLFDAIRISKGITTYADLSNVRIIRKNSLSNGGGKIETFLDFENVEEDIESKNIRIYDGDNIFISKREKPNQGLLINAIRSGINPKFITVFVTGKVNTPGEKIIAKASTLNDAIDISGGMGVLPGKIKYVSYRNNGISESRDFKYRRNAKRGSRRNPYLNDGDIIFVGNSILSNTSSIINEFTSPFMGLYSGYRLIEIFNE